METSVDNSMQDMQKPSTRKRFYHGHILVESDPEFQYVCYTVEDALKIIKKHKFFRDDWIIGVFKSLIPNPQEVKGICSLDPERMMLEWEKVLQDFLEHPLIQDPVPHIPSTVPDLRLIGEFEKDEICGGLRDLFKFVTIVEDRVVLGIAPDNRRLTPCPKSVANHPVELCLCEWNRLTLDEGERNNKMLPDHCKYSPLQAGSKITVTDRENSPNKHKRVTSACASIRLHFRKEDYLAVPFHAACDKDMTVYQPGSQNFIGTVDYISSLHDCSLVKLEPEITAKSESLDLGPYFKTGVPKAGNKYICSGYVSGPVHLTFVATTYAYKGLNWHLFTIDDEKIQDMETHGNCGALIYDDPPNGTVYAVWRFRPTGEFESNIIGENWIAAIAIQSFMPTGATLAAASPEHTTHDMAVADIGKSLPAIPISTHAKQSKNLKLFVGSISSSVTRKELKQYFENNGCKIKELHFKQTFAFLWLYDQESFNAAIALNKTMLKGKQLVVGKPNKKKRSNKVTSSK